MLRKITYIIILTFIMACKTKHEVIINPVIEDKKEIFSEEEIAKNIKSQISLIKDSSLLSIYSNSSFKPIWKSQNMVLNGINWINESKYHGLNPENYNILKINNLYNKTFTDTSINFENFAQLDILLTTNIKQCGYRIRFSNLNPTQFHSGWNYIAPNKLPNDSLWINLIKSEKIDQLNTFFEPKNILYSKLSKELKRIYSEKKEINELKIPDPGFLLQKGDSNQYVLPLKQKLLVKSNESTLNMKFDEPLSEAVKTFQLKHGLVPDGIVGKQTYHYLNWHKEQYINMIKANLERLRWLADDEFYNGITINIASQTLDFKSNNQSLYHSKVIVGTYKNQTPIFKSSINYLVFNPCWTVPKSIANTQILNGLKKDSSYLQKRNMFLSKNGIDVINDSIDFSQYSASYFPFTVYQRTSESNALGRVKFMFKNNFSVYLHDTPQKSLFNKSFRTYSHGCVRLDKALDFADFLLNKIDYQNCSLDQYLEKGYPVKVYLKKDIPINIIYLTCWYDAISDEVIYGKDVYLFDHILYNQLSNN